TAPNSRNERGEARPAGPDRRAARVHRVAQRAHRIAGRVSATPSLTARLEWGLVPAVPVPFRGREIADDAQRAYARWMAGQEIAGVAVWGHTGRGRDLTSAQRRGVLGTWGAAGHRGVTVGGVAS